MVKMTEQEELDQEPWQMQWVENNQPHRRILYLRQFPEDFSKDRSLVCDRKSYEFILSNARR